jgi:hypothetical protein
VAGPVAVPPADAAAGQPGVLAGQAVSMAGQAGRAMSWGRRIEKIILTLFCLEVGAFLLVFPWMPYWADNYFFSLLESWRPVVLSPYFRGAVSGLGALNLYLAIVESIAFVGSFLEEPARNEDQSSHRSS